MRSTNGDEESEHPVLGLGGFLASLRATRKLTLRQVEEATKVSNAYISQLETGRITKPSPLFLHKLAQFYGVPYDTLMEKAGYIASGIEKTSRKGAGGRVPTFVGEGLSQEEEEKLLEYLWFLRSRKGRS
ncbi:MAG: helix-turn-helix domain-containing protein [Candidatus Eisenbacteria bacterium]|nr:helix-turn-helix domain-containing protein [Candidatus Eisenbacteria bacterium]